jgi:hypothetical protein
MLGVVAERVPMGGALALAMMGGIGMLASGSLTSPLMGEIADKYIEEKLPQAETTAVIQEVAEVFPQLQAAAPAELAGDYQPAIDAAQGVLAKIAADPAGALPHPDTANALRAAIGAGGKHEVVGKASAVLNPADNYGGRMSFRYLAPFSIILIVVFGAMYARDRAQGPTQAKTAH